MGCGWALHPPHTFHELQGNSCIVVSSGLAEDFHLLHSEHLLISLPLLHQPWYHHAVLLTCPYFSFFWPGGRLVPVDSYALKWSSAALQVWSHPGSANWEKACCVFPSVGRVIFPSTVQAALAVSSTPWLLFMRDTKKRKAATILCPFVCSAAGLK